jgi:hypothetical protein
MRIWSLHPQYLDTKGLVALWREVLLAKKVLLGETKGYKHHPQLIRFKHAKKPIDAINRYLSCVYEEAVKRGYNFDKLKIDKHDEKIKLTVTSGQLDYELRHLLSKLKIRDIKKHEKIQQIKKPQCHPIFQEVKGEVEIWEIM